MVGTLKWEEAMEQEVKEENIGVHQTLALALARSPSPYSQSEQPQQA